MVDQVTANGDSGQLQRFSFLDGLRGYAALIVVVHHAFLAYVPALYTGLQKDSRFSWDLWLGGKPILLLFFAGNYAVCIFFVLSGFVLAHVFSRSTASPFELIVRRYVRLAMPILAANLIICAVGLTAIFIVPLQQFVPAIPGALDWQPTANNLLSALYECFREALITAPFFGIRVPTFNGVLWTMQIEFMGSFLLIGLFWIAKRIMPSDPKKAAAYLCMAGVAIFSTSQLSMFMIGAIIYWFFSQRTIEATKSNEIIGIVLIFVSVYLGTIPESDLRPKIANFLLRLTGTSMAAMHAKTLFGWAPFPILPIMLWHAVGAELLLVGLFYSSLARRFFSNKFALFLGFVSFPIYLIQVPVKELTADPLRYFLLANGAPELSTLLLTIAVATVATLGVGYVFAVAIERRSIRWSNLVGRAAARFVRLGGGTNGDPARSSV